MSNNDSTILREVEQFWNDNPCGLETGKNPDKKIYFKEVEQYRYKVSHLKYILEIENFPNYKNKDVLEIGSGVGIDGLQFVKNGAKYSGINIDNTSTQITKEVFRLFNHTGRFYKMNAEMLEFPDNSFDHIYSFGVIHHSPNTEKIVSEMYRVLRPGGTITIMVYNKSSINYYFEIMFLRKIFRYLLIPKISPKIVSIITGFNKNKLERHREIYLSEKMTKERWISINTDGPDCPLAKVYNKKTITKIFNDAGFNKIITYVRFFNKTHYSFIGKLIPNFVADRIGRIWGWHRIIKAVK